MIGTNSYIVNTTVDDTEIGQIADGDQATIVPTGSSTTDYGTVASISLIGSQSSNVTTFPVVIDVTGDPAGLYAGFDRRREHHRQAAQQRHRGPDGGHLLRLERPGDGHPGRATVPMS